VIKTSGEGMPENLGLKLMNLSRNSTEISVVNMASCKKPLDTLLLGVGNENLAKTVVACMIPGYLKRVHEMGLIVQLISDSY